MVMSRDTTISTNIRAIIEQLNFNPVERRRRLIDRNKESTKIRPVSLPAKITIGVYGCRDNTVDLKSTIIRNNDDVKKMKNINIVEFKNDDFNNTNVIFANNNNINDDSNIIDKEKRNFNSRIISNGGKVTIGIWGMSNSNNNKDEKIMIEKHSDGFVGSRLKKAEMRQRKPIDKIVEVTIDFLSNIKIDFKVFFFYLN